MRAHTKQTESRLIQHRKRGKDQVGLLIARICVQQRIGYRHTPHAGCLCRGDPVRRILYRHTARGVYPETARRGKVHVGGRFAVGFVNGRAAYMDTAQTKPVADGINEPPW